MALRRVVAVLAILALSQLAHSNTYNEVLNARADEIGPFELSIGRTLDGVSEQKVEVSIEVVNHGTAWPVAGFNLLIQYDTVALVFQTATAGSFLTDCAWEYFSYRLGATDDCGADHCPPGVIRIVAIAEAAGGDPAVHPDCYTNDGIVGEGGGASTSTELARLTFQVVDDPDVVYTFAPVRFLWTGCDDNSLMGFSVNTLLTSRLVYDYTGEIDWPPPSPGWREITGLDNELPTVTGAPSPACDAVSGVDIVRGADFYSGGVDIVGPIELDYTGDINCNGIRYEIADAIMYANYFLYGLSAFDMHVECSIAGSDVNRDGVTLTIADLTRIIGICIGDIPAYAKSTPSSNATADFSLDDGVVSVTGDCDISGVALVVRGDASPQLLATDMDMAYYFDGSVTRIVVTSPLDATSMHSFRGAFIKGIHDGIVSLELATSDGAPVNARNIPAHFSLSQNYPNPFNPVTTVEFALPDASDYRLTIYNIEGRLVDEFQGRVDAPGVFHVDWNAGDRASGVYLYRLDAGQYSQTRKMLLLK